MGVFLSTIGCFGWIGLLICGCLLWVVDVWVLGLRWIVACLVFVVFVGWLDFGTCLVWVLVPILDFAVIVCCGLRLDFDLFCYCLVCLYSFWLFNLWF